MDGTGGHCIKLNNSDIEKQIPHVLSHIWKLKKSQPECKIVITRGWEG
jgi:hypothetical protein